MPPWGTWLAVAALLQSCCLLVAVEFFQHSSFNWVDLPEEDMRAWYTTTDLCVLDNEERTSFPQDIRAKNCSKYSKGNRRMLCGVGMGNNNYPCYGPYGSARPSFKRGLQGYTNSSGKPMIEALKEMIRLNATLVLAGDSTMRQKLQAMFCELGREDRRIGFHGNIFGIVPCDTTLKVDFPDGQSITIHAVSLGPKSLECQPTAPSPTDVDVARHLARVVERVNTVENKSVVLVANMGLWYNDKAEFQQIAPRVVQYLATLATVPNRTNVVAWHETVLQHWTNDDGSGYFHKAQVDAQEKQWDLSRMANSSFRDAKTFMVPHCCVPIAKYSLDADWRNGIIHNALDANETLRARVHLLAMAGLTRDIPDMHTCNPFYKHDCTHYCYWPLLWQVLWHQIRDLAGQLDMGVTTQP